MKIHTRVLPDDSALLCSVPGPDTKLMQNSGRTKFKRTSIDRLMNTLVLWVGHLLTVALIQPRVCSVLVCVYIRSLASWCVWA